MTDVQVKGKCGVARARLPDHGMAGITQPMRNWMCSLFCTRLWHGYANVSSEEAGRKYITSAWNKGRRELQALIRPKCCFVENVGHWMRRC